MGLPAVMAVATKRREAATPRRLMGTLSINGRSPIATSAAVALVNRDAGSTPMLVSGRTAPCTRVATRCTRSRIRCTASLPGCRGGGSARNRLGKPATEISSDSGSGWPPSPVTGICDAPASSGADAKMMTSQWCSIPSALRMPCALHRAMGQVMSLQLGACNAV
ncbi:Uncharacterised protein [Mycobacteroides abscessus subsp. abscessus]|nr:Uncharacterised protein [Mycobacteroides abscessus subsp. abscessus]